MDYEQLAEGFYSYQVPRIIKMQDQEPGNTQQHREITHWNFAYYNLLLYIYLARINTYK